MSILQQSGQLILLCVTEEYSHYTFYFYFFSSTFYHRNFIEAVQNIIFVKITSRFGPSRSSKCHGKKSFFTTISKNVTKSFSLKIYISFSAIILCHFSIVKCFIF